MARYPLAAQRGLRTFIAQCDGCHAGATFSSGAIVNGFRVPALRGVALTAPYMHDGHIATLDQAVMHAGANAAQREDLVTFLRTLSPGGSSGPDLRP
jgi:cytochrome c peroxidase